MDGRISLITLGVKDMDTSVKFYQEGLGFPKMDSPSEEGQIIEYALVVGATSAKVPQKTDWGGYSGCFKDPDGHLREVAYHSFFRAGPEEINK